MLGGCPLTWASRLQSEIALSTTEAEYIALSTAMRDLLPTRVLLKEVGQKLWLSYCKMSTILSWVWEDNNGAIYLAEATNKVSCRTKHIAVKYHFFRENLSDEIQVKKIDTNDQLADIFTKGLAAFQFTRLASQLMGWVSSDEWQEQEEQEHPSGRESKWMRGSDVRHVGQRPRSLQSSMATVGPVQQVNQVQLNNWWYPLTIVVCTWVHTELAHY